MAKFRNLSEIQKYLEANTAKMLANSMDIERILADTMYEKVWQYVYDAHDPKEYNRREEEGGLADIRNYAITDFGVRDGKAYLVFENLTQGNDNLRTVYLTDTIEEGIKSNWGNPDGVWSNPRPFVTETVRALRENPQELLDAIKKGFEQQGMKVKQRSIDVND